MKNLLELGIRLIAFFYLYFLQFQFIGIIDSIISRIEDNYFPFSYYSAMQIIVIILAIIIFFKPNLITRFLKVRDDELKTSLDIYQLLRTGLILLGVYFLINSSTNIIYALMKLLNTKENVKVGEYFSVYYINIITNSILLMISFTLLKKSRDISNYLLKDKTTSDS